MENHSMKVSLMLILNFCMKFNHETSAQNSILHVMSTFKKKNQAFLPRQEFGKIAPIG